MATKSLTIAIDETMLQRIADALGPLKAAEVMDVCQKVAKAALVEWYEWIAGSRRYLSLTEQQIDRIAFLYQEFLPAERPSAADISYRFNVPDGPAGYISRVLSDRKFTLWREQGLKELRKVIQGRVKDAKKRLADNEGDKKTTIRLTKAAVRELERSFAECLKTNDSLSLPQRGATSGDQVEMSLEWAAVAALSELEELK